MQEIESNVYLLPYKHKYFKDVVKLNELRGPASQLYIVKQEIPRAGCLAFLGKQLIAVGFLRRVEPNYGQLDTFISNPLFDSKVRNEALTKVSIFLLEKAKEIGLTGILALTRDESIVKRAMDLGFTISPHVILGRRF